MEHHNEAARQLSSGKKTSKSPHDVPDPCANSQFQGLYKLFSKRHLNKISVTNFFLQILSTISPVCHKLPALKNKTVKDLVRIHMRPQTVHTLGPHLYHVIQDNRVLRFFRLTKN